VRAGVPGAVHYKGGITINGNEENGARAHLLGSALPSETEEPERWEVNEAAEVGWGGERRGGEDRPLQAGKRQGGQAGGPVGEGTDRKGRKEKPSGLKT
jgi:hypothetical protein